MFRRRSSEAVRSSSCTRMSDQCAAASPSRFIVSALRITGTIRPLPSASSTAMPRLTKLRVTIESPRGESGCYLVSDGGPKPWRVHFRAPSFAALEATPTCVKGALIADLIAIVGSLDAVMGDTDR